MTHLFDVHLAEVRTATVEIKTLTLGRKQVTQAVFRQLLEAPLLDVDSADLLGEPWGRVNYHPDRCTDDREHIHVVWQKGAQLWRAHIPRIWPAGKERAVPVAEAEDKAQRAFNLILLGRAIDKRSIGKLEMWMNEGHINGRLSVKGQTDRATYQFQRSLTQIYSYATEAYELPDSLRDWLYGVRPEPQHKAVRTESGWTTRAEPPSESMTRVKAESLNLFERMRNEYAQMARSIPEGQSAGHMFNAAVDNWHDLYAARERDKQAWADRYAELENIDHLFIAA